MERILNTNREEYEHLLIMVVFCSALTFKKIKKLEQYKAHLKKQLDVE